MPPEPVNNQPRRRGMWSDPPVTKLERGTGGRASSVSRITGHESPVADFRAATPNVYGAALSSRGQSGPIFSALPALPPRIQAGFRAISNQISRAWTVTQSPASSALSRPHRALLRRPLEPLAGDSHAPCARRIARPSSVAARFDSLSDLHGSGRSIGKYTAASNSRERFTPIDLVAGSL